jgi:hypothetical protein
MQRKEFIKRLIGVDLKTLFKLAGVLMLVYILLSFDFNTSPGNIVGVLKIIGFLSMIFLLLMVAAIIIFSIQQLLSRVLPGKFILWLRKYRTYILSAIGILLFTYFVYDFMRKEKYFALAFMIIYCSLSYLFSSKENLNKA